MATYWLTFSDGTRGSIQAANEQAAREKADEVKHSEIVVKMATLPYPANPVLARTNDCPAFCWQPDKCAGHTACPRPRACDD
jgi:hypothetical protein